MPKTFAFTPSLANVKLETLAARLAELRCAPREKISVVEFSDRLRATIYSVMGDIDEFKIAYFEEPPHAHRHKGVDRMGFEAPPGKAARGPASFEMMPRAPRTPGRTGFESPPTQIRCPLNDRRCKYYK